ncbi:MAG: aromatic-ring-hydroxylating dioxygenase subunit beta, partial [Candidatus Parcubacteria bacterium]|nr:aromatic-ring-hydroxylating dioxygenase subunit beta [Burkholderiales bacterium]
GGILIDADARPGLARVRAGWSCHVYSPKSHRQHEFFGRYDYLLRIGGDATTIVSKTVTLANDYIPSSIDFYCL